MLGRLDRRTTVGSAPIFTVWLKYAETCDLTSVDRVLPKESIGTLLATNPYEVQVKSLTRRRTNDETNESEENAALC